MKEQGCASFSPMCKCLAYTVYFVFTQGYTDEILASCYTRQQ